MTLKFFIIVNGIKEFPKNRNFIDFFFENVNILELVFQLISEFVCMTCMSP